MEKVKAKIADQQAKLKELEQKHREAENEEIVDIVRGMSVSLSDLPGLLQAVKAASGSWGPRKAARLCGGEEMQRACGFRDTLSRRSRAKFAATRPKKAEAKSEPKEEPVE